MPTPPRMTFARKVLVAALLIGLADLLFYGEEPGGDLGLFALAWTALLAAAVPALRRGPAVAALAGAAGEGLVLVDDPSPLAWLLFWLSLASATLLVRRRFRHAGEWAARLASFAVTGLVAPLIDLSVALRRRTGTGPTAVRVAAVLALPLLGGGLFLTLFAAANPLIANALGSIQFPDWWSALLHLPFWAAVLIAVWPSLRPRSWTPAPGSIGDLALPDVSLATLTLSLVTFNLLFAIENGLDIAFLWSGAPLPAGVTLADYAHRGAYSLIVTALLAGAFVLIAMRPDGAGARSPLVRRLVVLWVAQNLLLVASSVLRLLDYVAAFEMTVLRLAALLWMALVAVGLVLVCWRMLRAKSAAWLVNANAAAALVALVGASVVDLGATAAGWNVRQARAGDRLDLCYLEQLGPSALLPLIELERRAGGPVLLDRVRYLRGEALHDLQDQQLNWRTWTWRGARRLAAAQALLGPRPPAPDPVPYGRRCGGQPLTRGAGR